MLLCASGFAGTGKETNCAPPSPCGPKISKKDQKKAKHLYEQGLKLLHETNNENGSGKDVEEAMQSLQEAARIDPTSLPYAFTLELAKQQAVEENIKSANQLLAAGSKDGALHFYREALAIDPSHPAASQALVDAAAVLSPPKKLPITYEDGPDEAVLEPLDKIATFHYRGDTRGLLDQICSLFGIKAIFDNSFVARPTRFDLEDGKFAQVLEIAQRMAKTFTVTLGPKQLLFITDDADNRRTHELLALRIFRVPSSSPQEFADLYNVLRNLFDFRYLTPISASSSIIVRAPRHLLEAAGKMIDQISQGAPEVMLDVRAYEVSSDFLRDLGIPVPTQYQILNVNTVLRSLTSAPGAQQLINQLISSGAINQATAAQIPALLAALAAQQNPLLSQGIATFGGGITREAIAVPALAATISYSKSTARNLQHVTLRATNGNAATFRSGVRYPILNASFSPAASSPAINQALGNQSFQAPFPSFSYEDLGITLKATPQVHGQSDVTLQLDLQIRALGTQSFNGIPVISNRQFTGTITLKNGEPAAIMGNFTFSSIREKAGIPGFGSIPGLDVLTGSNHKQESEAEVLILVTPHIVRDAGVQDTAETWLPK